MTRLRLGVNIDHVATIRNARGGFAPDPARALHSRSQRSACMKTRFFCRKTGLCSPEDSTKWPSRRAPAARNSSSTSSVFMASGTSTARLAAPNMSTPTQSGPQDYDKRLRKRNQPQHGLAKVTFRPN